MSAFATVPRVLVAAALVAMLGACSGVPMRGASPITYLLVRHAEKDTSAGSDPPLTAAGIARADGLARLLADAPLVAIYSTPTRRTRQTAAPTAVLHDLDVRDYDPADPGGFAAQLRKHRAGTVLVLGHSNTLPPLARALCGCQVTDMDEAVYGVRYTIEIDPLGRARFREFHDRP